MLKVIIFDVDGVIIKIDKFFSHHLAKRLNLDLDKDVSPFFNGIFQECLTGNKDLKVEILPWIKNWNWSGSVDELLEYWFSNERNINTEVLNLAKRLKSQKIKLFLGTNNEKHRLNDLMNNLELKEVFEEAFSSDSIGFKKNNPEFFKKILVELIEIKPEEILFIDDDQKNLDVAKEIGINTIFFDNYPNLLKQLKTYPELKI